MSVLQVAAMAIVPHPARNIRPRLRNRLREMPSPIIEMPIDRRANQQAAHGGPRAEGDGQRGQERADAGRRHQEAVRLGVAAQQVARDSGIITEKLSANTETTPSTEMARKIVLSPRV